MKPLISMIVVMFLAFLIYALIHPKSQTAQTTSPPPLPKFDLSREYDPPVKKQFEKRLEYIELIKKNRGSHSQLAWSYGQLCRLFHAYQHMNDARDCYLNAIHMDSKQEEWPYLLAHVYMVTGFKELAIRKFLDSQALIDSIEVKYWLAHMYYLNQQFDEAETLFLSVLEEEPRHGMSLYGLSKIMQHRNHFEAAIKMLQIILEDQPQAYQANYLLGQLFRQTGEIQKSTAILNTITDSQFSRISIHLKDPLMQEVADLRISSQAQMRLGMKAVAQKKYKSAIFYFNNAVSANPKRTDAHYSLAYVWFLTGNFETAKEQLSSLLVMEPNHRRALQLEARINKMLNKNLEPSLIIKQ